MVVVSVEGCFHVKVVNQSTSQIWKKQFPSPYLLLSFFKHGGNFYFYFLKLGSYNLCLSIILI